MLQIGWWESPDLNKVSSHTMGTAIAFDRQLGKLSTHTPMTLLWACQSFFRMLSEQARDFEVLVLLLQLSLTRADNGRNQRSSSLRVETPSPRDS